MLISRKQMKQIPPTQNLFLHPALEQVIDYVCMMIYK